MGNAIAFGLVGKPSDICVIPVLLTELKPRRLVNAEAVRTLCRLPERTIASVSIFFFSRFGNRLSAAAELNSFLTVRRVQSFAVLSRNIRMLVFVCFDLTGGRYL